MVLQLCAFFVWIAEDAMSYQGVKAGLSAQLKLGKPCVNFAFPAIRLNLTFPRGTL
ncbi:MAG: hypothetical protein K0R65_611 [Crocinitomicaceae bacterium]|jgi:hypothetical protein|nr:hypothetical protein [Crocinitomicaceae bacterium]